jgi:ketosteroid isomerase-like protein
MSADNASVVRALLEAAARGDWDAAMAAYDPEVEIDTTQALPDGRVYHGLEGVDRSWRTWRGPWSAYDFKVEELTEAGDRVLAVLHIRGRAKGSGIEVERRQAEVYTLRDGRIVGWKLYSDPSEARREAALP